MPDCDHVDAGVLQHLVILGRDLDGRILLGDLEEPLNPCIADRASRAPGTA